MPRTEPALKPCCPLALPTHKQFCRMLLPDLAPGGGNTDRQRTAGREHDREGGDSPRHVVLNARSGVWAVSGASHFALPPEEDDDDE